MNITFLLPVNSHVRYQKRISGLKRLGINEKILSFQREYYSGKPWSDSYITLAKIEHGNYLKRIIPLMKSLPKIISESRDSDVIYAFGLDMLMLAYIAKIIAAGQQKLIYEVGDLGNLPKKGIRARVLRLIEKGLIRDIRCLVVTSNSFIDEYYLKVQKLEGITYRVIENKIDPITFPRQLNGSNKSINNQIRIGYFGVIRCKRSWETIIKINNLEKDRFQFYVRGINLNIDGFMDDVMNYSTIDYGGEYVSPDDLNQMYNRIDLVWGAHLMGKYSTQWNRANRFYEACYYQKPLIVQKNTKDSIIVNNYDIGICIDMTNPQKAANKILNINDDDINFWRENIASVPEYFYTLTDEHERLLSCIV